MRVPPRNEHLLTDLEAQTDYLKDFYGSSTIVVKRSKLIEEHNLLHIFETGTGTVQRIAMGRFVEVPFTVTEGYGANKQKIVKRVVKFIPELDKSSDNQSTQEEPKKGFFSRFFS